MERFCLDLEAGCSRRCGTMEHKQWALLACIRISRANLKGSGPGGVRSVWDHGAKREQGTMSKQHRVSAVGTFQ